MRTHTFTRTATTLCLGVAALMLSACNDKKNEAAPQAMPAPEVQVAKLITKDVDLQQEWVGILRGTEDAEIRSQVTGYLLSKDYKDGAYVTKGQTLFQIDPRPFQAALAQAEGRLEQYEATLKQYKLDVARYTPLVKTGSISRKQLDDAMQQVQATEASIVTAKAQVEEAKINLKFTTITAPISGLAGLATPSIGNLLTPTSTTPLTTISAINPIRVDFSISEQDFLNATENGQNTKKAVKFNIILANGSLYPQEGEVVAIDRNVDSQTGTINIVGHIPNPDLILRPGMFVRVQATTKTLEQATLVPARAILPAQSAHFIVYLDDKNIPHMQLVKLGPLVDGLQAVTIVPMPNSTFTKDSPIVIEGIMQAARIQGQAPVDPKPYQATVSQPVIPSIGAKSFNEAQQPAGMTEANDKQAKQHPAPQQ